MAFCENLETETSKCEAVFLAKLFKDFVEFIAVYFHNPVALFTDNMEMVVYSIGFFIVCMFVAKVDFVNQVKFKEQVECMIDGCP